MKVIINDKEITLKSSFRAMVAYEQITDHIFSPSTVTDILVYFYCCIISSKDYDGTMTFDEFMKINDYSKLLTGRKTVIVYCVRGGSSIYAAYRLIDKGYHVKSLIGGMTEYEKYS